MDEHLDLEDDAWLPGGYLQGADDPVTLPAVAGNAYQTANITWTETRRGLNLTGISNLVAANATLVESIRSMTESLRTAVWASTPAPLPGGWGYEHPDDPFYRARFEGAQFDALETAARDRLLASLTWEQRETWRRAHYWDLDVPASGHRYRIIEFGQGNIYRHADHMRFCLAHPSPYVPTWVALTCQVWLLTHDEARFLRTANALGTVPVLPGLW